MAINPKKLLSFNAFMHEKNAFFRAPTWHKNAPHLRTGIVLLRLHFILFY